VSLVEPLCLRGDRVPENGTDSTELGGLQGPENCIAQQAGAELPVLIRPVNRKAGEHHNRYRVRHVAAHSAGRRFVHHTAGCEGMVADDSAAGADHIRAGSAGLLVGESAPFQPVIEGGIPESNAAVSCAGVRCSGALISSAPCVIAPRALWRPAGAAASDCPQAVCRVPPQSVCTPSHPAERIVGRAARRPPRGKPPRA
jgi:hypothetical protein